MNERVQYLKRGLVRELYGMDIHQSWLELQSAKENSVFHNCDVNQGQKVSCRIIAIEKPHPGVPAKPFLKGKVWSWFWWKKPSPFNSKKTPFSQKSYHHCVPPAQKGKKNTWTSSPWTPWIPQKKKKHYQVPPPPIIPHHPSILGPLGEFCRVMACNCRFMANSSASWRIPGGWRWRVTFLRQTGNSPKISLLGGHCHPGWGR